MEGGRERGREGGREDVPACRRCWGARSGRILRCPRHTRLDESIGIRIKEGVRGLRRGKEGGREGGRVGDLPARGAPWRTPRRGPPLDPASDTAAYIPVKVSVRKKHKESIPTPFIFSFFIPFTYERVLKNTLSLPPFLPPDLQLGQRLLLDSSSNLGGKHHLQLCLKVGESLGSFVRLKKWEGGREGGRG